MTSGCNDDGSILVVIPMLVMLVWFFCVCCGVGATPVNNNPAIKCHYYKEGWAFAWLPKRIEGKNIWLSFYFYKHFGFGCYGDFGEAYGHNEYFLKAPDELQYEHKKKVKAEALAKLTQEEKDQLNLR